MAFFSYTKLPIAHNAHTIMFDKTEKAGSNIGLDELEGTVSLWPQSHKVSTLVLLAAWFIFAGVSTEASKSFFKQGGDPVTSSLCTFLVGSLPLLFSSKASSLITKTYLLPVAAFHCGDLILNSLYTDKAYLRSAYSVKSFEPCLTLLIDAFLFTGVTIWPEIANSAFLPIFSIFSLSGTYALSVNALLASLLSVVCVSGRAVLFKRQEKPMEYGSLVEFSTISAFALLLSSPLGAINFLSPRQQTQWTAPIIQSLALSVTANFISNCASFELLRRLTPVDHSSIGVLARLTLLLIGSTVAQQVAPVYTVLAFSALCACLIVPIFCRESESLTIPAEPTWTTKRWLGLSLAALLSSFYLSYGHRQPKTDIASLPSMYQQQCAQFSANELPVLTWIPGWETGSNFGDDLSAALVARIVGRDVEILPLGDNIPKNDIPRMLAIGSIGDFSRPCDVLWGTGMHRHDIKFPFDPALLGITALRGPLSAKVIKQMNPDLSVPSVYGDPGLLMSHYFPEFRSANPKGQLDSNVLVVLHYLDTNAQTSERGYSIFTSGPEKGYSVVSAVAPRWQDVVERIANASFVISSSLHGLIVADSYGIPSRGIQLNLLEPPFKYADYYLGTNRPNFRLANSVEEALWLGPEDPPEIDLEALRNAFPSHIFNKT